MRERLLRQTPTLIAAYFLIGCLMRLASSPTLEMDEAEQVLLSQLPLRWVYGSQPPLYTWLQSFVFKIFGESIFSLVILKNFLLASTFLLTWATIKRLTASYLYAAIGALLLMLVPQYIWESQRDLTHSVLVTTCTALTVYLLVRIYQTQSLSTYIALGLAIAAGMLSKYNFIFPVAGFIIAAFFFKQTRECLFNYKALITTVIAVLIIAYQLSHVLSSQAEVSTDISDFAMTSISMTTVFKGLYSFIGNTFAFVVLLVAIPFAALYGSEEQDELQEDALDIRKYFGLSLLTIILITLAIFAVTGGTDIKDRWLQPLYYVLPLYLCLRLAPHYDEARQNLVMIVSAVVGLVIFFILPLQPILSPMTGNPSRRNVPYRELAEKLIKKKENLPQIIANNRRIGGNLKLLLPHARVITADLPSVSVDPTLPTLVIWNGGESNMPPQNLFDLVRDDFGIELPDTPLDTVTAKQYYTSKHNFTLAYDIINSQ
ncbi:glycosyltransferase family 39 protein [Planctomycetota bacterium]|nr:glycosyltransferase family 39 protein [Planctomycetota bacterium]